MRAIIGVTAIGLLATTTTLAAAQDEGDIAAWYAMMVTPFGALPPIVTPTMAGMTSTDGRRPLSLDFRYGHWDFGDGEEPWNTFGLGVHARNLGIVVGYEKCEECSDGVLMGGVEFDAVLFTSEFASVPSPASLIVGVRPGIGFAKPLGDMDGSAFSATVDLPISFSIPVGTGWRLVPFVAPGFGYGRFNEEEGLVEFGGDESGTRVSFGAGVGLLASAGFGAHVGWRKILIEEGPGMVGVGLSFGR